jgi:phosphoribosyl 1,2-cyclic phosphodiesterase
VTEKILSAFDWLRKSDAFEDLFKHGGSNERLRAWVTEQLPIEVRSTYGGNTSCVEIRTDESMFIVDAGSGLRELGSSLNHRWNLPDYTGHRQGHVLITHAHLDHTTATPFNDAFYNSRNDFRIWAPQAVLDSLTALLGPKSRLRSVYFPIHFDLMRGIKEFRSIEVGSEFEIEGTRISTYALNHPGGCVAYRFERGGRRIVFASDHEHDEVPDRGLAEFCRGADLLYTDAQYLQAEYDGQRGLADEAPQSRHGWGHSTVEAAIATALAAEVRLLHLGHHDPKRSDQGLARMANYAEEQLKQQLRAAGRPPDSCRVQLAAESLRLKI